MSDNTGRRWLRVNGRGENEKYVDSGRIVALEDDGRGRTWIEIEGSAQVLCKRPISTVLSELEGADG